MAAFLRNLVSRIRPAEVSVAAFGKHPAWDDHMPDIGLVGPLIDIKKVLYLDGIRDKAISYWKSADRTQLIPFDHDLLWHRPDALVVGRLWQSSDGANPPRRDFPMVLLADCGRLSVAWAIQNVLPRLMETEAACKAISSGDQVRTIVAQAQENLRKLVTEQRPGDDTAAGISPGLAVTELAQLAELGPEHRGLLRVLYVLSGLDPSALATHTRAEQVRVPRGMISSASALELWRKTIVARFGEKVETLLLAPRDQTWIDVLIGKPDPVQINVLRASPQLIPLTTEINFSMTPTFVEEAEHFLASCRGASGESAPWSAGPALTAKPAPVSITESAPASVQLSTASAPRETASPWAPSVEPSTIPPPIRNAAPGDSPKSLRPWIAVGIAMVVLGIALLILPHVLKTPPARQAEDWTGLCREYGSWFGDFQESLDDPARRQRYEADPDLKKVVQTLTDAKAAGIPIDPRAILSRPGMNYTILAAKAAEKPQPPETVAKYKVATALIADVKRQISPENWSLLREARELQKRFGPTPAGKNLGSLADQINPDAAGSPTAGIDHLLAVAPQIKAVQRCLATLATVTPLLEGSGDPSLKSFGQDADADLASSAMDLTSLNDEAVVLEREVIQVATLLTDEWRTSIDREQFLEHTRSAMQGKMLSDRLRWWLDEVAKYRRQPP